MTMLSIISVTYNSSHIIAEFLNNLALPAAPDCEVIVVDSGSQDWKLTASIVEKAGHRFVRSSRNVGYGAGSNLGANMATGAWLLFVNPDVQMSYETAVRLVSVAQEHDVTCIGPTVLNEEGVSKRSYGRTVTPPWRRRTQGFRTVNNLIYAETISGCCMAVHSGDFHRVGGFDERFFMFCEEMDLHRRLTDTKSVVATSLEVTVTTAGGASSKGVTEHWRLVERMVGHTNYIFKHFTVIEGWLAIGYNLAKICILPGYSSRRESYGQFFRGVRGIFESR